MYILQDELTDGRIDQLITAHIEEMKEHSPPESIHALPLTDLKNRMSPCGVCGMERSFLAVER